MAHDGSSVLLDRFGLLLLLVLSTVVGQALIDVGGSFLGSSVAHAISGAALLVAVRAAGVTTRWRRAADLLVAVVLAVNVVLVLLQLLPGERLEMEPATGPEFLWLIAAALAPVVVARRLVEQRTVTVQTLLGAVAAYLQIAVAYAFAFQALDAVGARPLFGVQVPTTSYMYASLTALSTLGYGDLVPMTELGRLVAVSEAIVGQVFLVTFVAMLASRYASKPVSPPDTQHGTGTGLDDGPA
jgi:Ion channel